MTSLIGTTIGNYRIEALLGSGGMGQVFRAHHLHLDRRAAIKLMHAHLAHDPGFQARFRQEARAIAALQHPHIVEVYDFGQQDDRIYLVLEFVPDGSLRALLQQYADTHQSWPIMRGLDLVRQAADGLAYAHTQGMVHRDIKPDNLLLTRTPPGSGPAYTLKISDFGLARLAEGSMHTASGVAMGTPAYMSPEQCQGTKLDGRSDLYALGVVLYEVTTGYLPFAAKTLTEAAYKHVHVAPTPPREVRPDLPPDVEAIILCCLAKRPEERYATATELVKALSAVLPEPQPPEVAPSDPVTQIAPTRLPDREVRAQMGMVLDPPTLVVTPGQVATVSVILANLGTTAAQATLAVDGVPATWVQDAGGTIRLDPGTQTTIRLTVQVPPDPATPTGDYPVTVRAQSPKGEELGVAQMSWTVQPSREQTLAIAPKEALRIDPQETAALRINPPEARGRRGATYALTLQNTGSRAMHYTLMAHDDAQVLTYQFDRNRVDLEPGATTSVALRVGGIRRRIGRVQRRVFRVQAQQDGTGGGPIASARFLHQALVPPWLPPVAIGVLVAFCFSLINWPPEIQPSEPTPIAEASPTVEANPTAEPSPIVPDPRARIAFASNRDGNLNIYTMNPDGSDMIRLTEHPADDTHPTWSPDGRFLLFTSHRDGNGEIYMMDADGSNQQNLTNNASNDGVPAWSPDGAFITFRSERAGNVDIYKMRADGSNQTRLTSNPGDDTDPEWSPDGRHIAFISFRNNNWDIYLMDADGNNQTRLTSHSSEDRAPAWSPNGDYLAFMALRTGNFEIFTMNRLGNELARVTQHPAADSTPDWSPDGNQIVFSSRREVDPDIYVINVDGSELIPLTRSPADDIWPTWSP